MKKKKLKVQVAALAMTGAIAAAPLTVRAEEASTAAPATASTSSTEAPATAAAPAASTATTPAVSGTTGGASTPATGTAATTGTGATATGAGTSTVATAGTGATASTGTAATATTEASAPAAVAAPVTVAEAPADPATTVPNNVDTVVPDDNKQGTDIVAETPILNVDTTVTPEEAKGEGTIGDKVQGLPAVLGNVKNKDVVMQGDLSIAKDNSIDFDSTSNAAHEVNKEDSYSLKADLDVNAVNNAINASAQLNSLMKTVNIDKMETGLRSTFEMGRDLEGSFHLPTDLEDAKKHYELSSADGSPMMYRINYGNSSFAKDKVSIAMDLDLSKYQNPKAEISTFGALNDLINKSAKKIQLIMKGIKFNAAHGNVEETETATEKTTSAEGTIRGTLVGYMKADVSKEVKVWFFTTTVTGKAAYNWGAIQNEEGRDFVAGRDRVAGNDNGNNKVDLTVKMTTTESKVKPVEPVQPEEPVKPETPEVPVQPAQPVTPVAPSNGGGRTGVTPATPSRTTIPGTVLGENRPTASTPTAPVGEVLGENRETPVAETVEKKQGAVLGESRPSVKGVSDRASVATGDYNFTGLWASLFGISLAALAGFVVLQKKKEN
ncbi:cell surface protein [Oribacterium sinus]|uniref:cell surface protein n=1 Tax=Oribacterium sinus TaxID=237576 RepID=UPI0028E96969|nr:cell surface protein [Oribacterium sinus]